MIISIYISNTLSRNSQKGYDQGGVFFLDISEDERDLYNILNECNNQGGEYPDWDELALCLRKDWKLIKSWKLPENVTKQKVRYTFSCIFDRPDILRDIKSAIEMYSIQLHAYDPCLSHTKSKMSSVYCLNKEVFKTFWWCFDANDHSHAVLMENIILDMVQRLTYRIIDESRVDDLINFDCKVA